MDFSPEAEELSLSVSSDLINEIPVSLVTHHQVMPLERSDKGLVFASVSSDDIVLKDLLEQELGEKVTLVPLSFLDIQKLILFYYGDKDRFSTILTQLQGDTSDTGFLSHPPRVIQPLSSVTMEAGTVTDIFDYLVSYAITRKASDIHIEPFAEDGLIRLRTDGVLHRFQSIPLACLKRLISFIKVESGMDITQTRLPQDGQLEVSFYDHLFDMRITTIPTVYGEKVSIRLLGVDMVSLGLDSLGFLDKDVAFLRDYIHHSSGLILISGPTGSGKTSTLFSILQDIKSLEKNIVTIENPVEYRLPLLNQIEINEAIGLDFETAIRCLLRQDPDVILIGEIRDRESARLAVQSALAGTLLLTTLHSNNAIGTIDRLINMGVDRYWVGAVLSCVVSQRLVRSICLHCKVSYTPNEESLNRLELDVSHTYYKGEGCELCTQSGFLGRTPIYEILNLTATIKQAIFDSVTPVELKQVCLDDGFQTFKSSAQAKIESGLTTVEEVFRILSPDLL